MLSSFVCIACRPALGAGHAAVSIARLLSVFCSRHSPFFLGAKQRCSKICLTFIPSKAELRWLRTAGLPPALMQSRSARPMSVPSWGHSLSRVLLSKQRSRHPMASAQGVGYPHSLYARLLSGQRMLHVNLKYVLGNAQDAL